MKKVLMDIYLAEAYSNLTYDNRNRDNTMLTRYKEAELFIFKKYKITSKRFESSMEFYLYHDPDLNKIYDEMYSEFSEKRKKILKDSDNYRRKDSILHPEKKIKADRLRDSLINVVKKNTAKIKRRDSLLKLYPKLNPSFRSKKRRKTRKPSITLP